jgi:predicted RecA/RadA family phage recombinase
MKTPDSKTLKIAACAISCLILFGLSCLTCGVQETLSLVAAGGLMLGLTYEAEYRQKGETLDHTPATALTAGQVIQLPDGRAAVPANDIAASALGAVSTCGLYVLQKTADIVILDGGQVYWDHSENKAHYKKVHDRDFYVGVAVGDSVKSASTVTVALNVQPVYLVDVARDPIDSVLVLTAGTPQLRRLGGAQSLQFSATAEAQKIDILSKDGFSLAANAIIECAVEVVDNGDAAAPDFNIGAANATHASDADSITESIFVHIDGNALDIKVESDDGTTEVAATDTTLDYAEGTRFEVWIDLRDPAAAKVYVNGVRVLDGTTGAATTLDISAATGPLKLLAHLEKTADDTPGEFHVDWLRARIAEQ